MYYWLGAFSEGMAGFRNKAYSDEGRKLGFINTSGNLVIKEIFDDAGDFSDGLAAAVSNGALGFVERLGSFVIPPQYDKYVKNKFTDGLISVRIE